MHPTTQEMGNTDKMRKYTKKEIAYAYNIRSQYKR